MDPETEVLVRLSAAVASGDARRRSEAMRGALDRARPRAVEEALLQSYLFLGFPAALTALAEWRALTGHEPESQPGDEDPDQWLARGSVVCRTVYGRAYEKLRGSVRRVHPALDDWMVREGYGKVLARDGLDLASRELCIVAILGATGWEPQLHSHLRGALHAGCDPVAVAAALDMGLEANPSSGWPDEARSLWERVRGRHANAGTGS